jgi:hypothetical protein
VDRVGEQNEHVINTAIALALANVTHERLNVANACFSLYTDQH